ncbi:MAG: VTT domain-containing protein [Candidatus Omnitrophica bacterium]|nr:VTT domain-containing protein [Candidatus Omnitrophota bacterium]
MSRFFYLDTKFYSDLLTRFPIWLSGLIFIVLYVVLTFFIWFGPKDVLRIASALLFGAYVSTILLWAGEMINTIVLFHLSRRLGREYIVQKFHLKKKQMDKIDQAKSHRSFIGALALKSNVLFPMRFLDLGFGLTDISFRKYFYASLVALPLRILLFQYILELLGGSYINLFTDINAVMQFYFRHPYIFLYTGLYFFFLGVLTLLALINKSRKTFHSKK